MKTKNKFIQNEYYNFAKTNYGIDLTSKTRKQEVIKHKHVIAYILFYYENMHEKDIAEIINYSRTMIYHINRKINFDVEYYKDIKLLLHEYLTKVKIDIRVLSQFIENKMTYGNIEDNVMYEQLLLLINS